MPVFRSRRSRSRLLTAVTLALTGTVATFTADTAAHAADVPASDYQQVALATGSASVGEPMSLAVLPNRSVLHTSRDGKLRITAANGLTRIAGQIPVYQHDEEGLQGVAIDPGFATNRYVYLYYSPVLNTPAGDAPLTGTAADFAPFNGQLNLSRFTLKADDTLDLASERVVLTVPANRGICCHVGGDIDFDAAGNLYLTTGDDTNPFDSANFAPIDERADRNPAFDAQRTSANTNDLRGKVLRIKVNADGTYSIPSGNLFPSGTANTRPEIYAMGLRNPFRMSVDKATGIVYLGDYGPDAGTTDPNRGPSGQVEFDRITSAGNYGWPYCTGTNTTGETYNEWNFATNSTGPKYNCAGGPTNNSPRNTGLGTLPAARASWIRYGGDSGTPPEFDQNVRGNGGESPMGGPVYRYDAANPSQVKFPQSLDGRYFAGELGRQWIKAIAVNANGTPGEISGFPWTGTQVMDMAFGPDGALYVLDYGLGWGANQNSGLYRVEYLGPGGNHNPIAKATATPTSGQSPLAVTFRSDGSYDPENGALTYAWTFSDGATGTGAQVTKTFATVGTYTATLTVTDPQGKTGTASVAVTVGNTAPTVTLTLPADGQLFNFGDTVPFQVTATDPEDGPVDCSRVTVAYAIGHDQHAHDITSKPGCTGSITIPADGEHDASANIYGLFSATYTDNGGLTGKSQRVLQPRHRQGEHYSSQSGVQPGIHAAAEGGRTAGFIENGDWIAYQPYVLSDVNRFTARVSSAGPGGTIEIRAGAPNGQLLGSVAVPPTGSWETFWYVSTSLNPAPAGPTQLYLRFTGAGATLFDLDSFTLASGPAQPAATALRASANNRIVTAENSGAAALIANRDTVGPWEQFDVIDLGGGSIALRARINGKFVTADNGGGSPLIANRTAIGPWEQFTLITNSDGTFSLRAAANGKYVCADNGGASPLIANRDTVGPWEKFRFV